MGSDHYSVGEVERWLAVELEAQALPEALSGEWATSKLQAGYSQRTGSYLDWSGAEVGNDGEWWAGARDAISWRSVREVQPTYPAETLLANVHGQTKWFGPHRRVVMVRRPASVLLATDGLSTPWAGILVEMGDRVADGFRWVQDVQENGPMVSFRLPEDRAPATRIVLSPDDAAAVMPPRIGGLPFGAALLLTAMPVTDKDLAGLDLSGTPSAETARIALSRHAARLGAAPARNGP